MKDDTNYGVLVEIQPTDWVAGISSGITYKDLGINWSDYLAGKERQYPPETSACVSFSCNHSFDTQITAFIKKGYFAKEAVDYFQSAGYLDELGRFNSSDKFAAIGSGTTKAGNYQQTVLDFVRKNGLLPEKDLPFGTPSTWEEYMNPAQVTQAMRDKAKKILTYIDIAYEWVIQKGDGSSPVNSLTYHLKHAPIQITAPVCYGWNQGADPIPTCSLDIPQHATLVYSVSNEGIEILDQYPPFLRTLAKNYPVLWGLKIVVTIKELIPKITTDNATITFNKSWTAATWASFKAILTRMGIRFKETIGKMI